MTSGRSYFRIVHWERRQSRSLTVARWRVPLRLTWLGGRVWGRLAGARSPTRRILVVEIEWVASTISRPLARAYVINWCYARRGGRVARTRVGDKPFEFLLAARRINLCDGTAEIEIETNPSAEIFQRRRYAAISRRQPPFSPTTRRETSKWVWIFDKFGKHCVALFRASAFI